jgi:hypothetical protein
VLTTSDRTRVKRHKECSTPHPSDLVESPSWGEISGKSLPKKGL